MDKLTSELLGYEKAVLEFIHKRDEARGVTSYCPRLIHAKSPGLITATFVIADDIPEQYRIGLFAKPGAVYQAHLRFSSSFTRPTQHDKLHDGRGLSIKLYDVLNPDNGETQNHNFTFINYPAFFWKDPVEAKETFKVVATRTLGSVLRFIFPKFPWPWPIRSKFFAISFKIQRKNGEHMLNSQFYSMVPFKLGNDIEVKYSVKSTLKTIPMPAKLSPEFIKDTLADYLKSQSAEYEFLVQIRKNDMPIEDPTVIWDEKQSPFLRFAKIYISPQQFDTPEKIELGEQMEFPVDEVLPQHRPVGHINEVRIDAMKFAIAYRKQFCKAHREK